MQSKEDDEMTNLFSPEVKLIPNLVTRIEESLENAFGKLNFDKISDSTLQRGVLSQVAACGHLPREQISRGLHQRLSELFLLEFAGYTEHSDWKSSWIRAGRRSSKLAFQANV